MTGLRDSFGLRIEERAGSAVAINCIAGSPTFGGVYDMTHGVGLNRLASSLSAFFNASTAAIEQKLIRYDDGMLLEHPRFLLEANALFCETPYFQRVGQMGKQIVDWK